MYSVTSVICPVCGYDRLRRPVQNDDICPCCGTHFGYEDAAPTEEGRQQRWKELRAEWRSYDYPWFSPVTLPPAHWDPHAQLLAAGLVTAVVNRGTRSTKEIRSPGWPLVLLPEATVA